MIHHNLNCPSIKCHFVGIISIWISLSMSNQIFIEVAPHFSVCSCHWLKYLVEQRGGVNLWCHSPVIIITIIKLNFQMISIRMKMQYPHNCRGVSASGVRGILSSSGRLSWNSRNASRHGSSLGHSHENCYQGSALSDSRKQKHSISGCSHPSVAAWSCSRCWWKGCLYYSLCSYL